MSFIKKCGFCEKQFSSKGSVTKFCSRSCGASYNAKLKMGHNNPRWVLKIKKQCKFCKKTFEYRQTTKVVPHFCSIKCYGESLKKEKVKYYTLHSNMRRMYGNPPKCEFCGLMGERKNNRWTIEWANLNKIKKDINTMLQKEKQKWIGLCVRCHRNLDKKDFCKHGHKFTKENTKISKRNDRVCLTCYNYRNSKAYTKYRLPINFVNL